MKDALGHGSDPRGGAHSEGIEALRNQLLNTRHRRATTAEILAKNSPGRKIGFRHFMKEIYDPRTETGVRHQEWSRGKLQVVNGEPHVQHHGELQKLTGTHTTLPSGLEIVHDLRLDSPHLKGVEDR